MIYKHHTKAKTITKELLDRLNGLVQHGKPTDVELDQIIFASQSLKNKEVASYHYVKGVCECLRGNVEVMRTEFETAYSLEPGIDIYEGYNLALAYSNFHREVVQRYLDILRNDNAEPGYVASAALGILNYGLVKDYLDLCAPKLKRYEFASFEYESREMLESLTRTGFTQEDLSEFIYSAYDTFSEFNLPIYARQFTFDSSDNDMVFVVRMLVKGVAKELNKLESDVISKLINKNIPVYDADMVNVIVAPIQG